MCDALDDLRRSRASPLAANHLGLIHFYSRLANALRLFPLKMTNQQVDLPFLKAELRPGNKYISYVTYLNQGLISFIQLCELRKPEQKNGFRLQCKIEYSANQKLEALMTETGLSKGELISKLINAY